MDREHGFSYEVIEESGSGVIRSKVLRAALETEANFKSADADRVALNHANYEFVHEERTDDVIRVAIRPRRRAPMLLEGDIVLSEPGADLMRVEGTLVKRPSFWTRRVDVVRQYARIAGVRVPISISSDADVLFAGRSSFSMSYRYEEINGETVQPQ